MPQEKQKVEARKTFKEKKKGYQTNLGDSGEYWRQAKKVQYAKWKSLKNNPKQKEREQKLKFQKTFLKLKDVK